MARDGVTNTLLYCAGSSAQGVDLNRASMKGMVAGGGIRTNKSLLWDCGCSCRVRVWGGWRMRFDRPKVHNPYDHAICYFRAS
jgi:hypothetical protein